MRTTHRITTKHGSLTFDLTHDLDLGCSRSNFKIALSPELLVWLMWNEKEVSWCDSGQIVWPCPLTTPITLGVSKSEPEIALSQEWGGRLTMSEKDVSHPWYWLVWPWWGGRMYRIVTGVTSDVGVPSTYLVCSDNDLILNSQQVVPLDMLSDHRRSQVTYSSWWSFFSYIKCN